MNARGGFLSKKKFLKELKHQKSGLRVRALKKHLGKDYEWKMITHTIPYPAPLRAFRVVSIKHICIDEIPVLVDIEHVYNVMLSDTKEELANYLLSNDLGIRKFAEKRYKELESKDNNATGST